MSLIRALPSLRAGLSARTFTTSAVANKSLTDSVKETASTINKKVGETLAAGIEKTESASASAKQTVADKTPSEAETKQTLSSAASKAEQTSQSVKESTNATLGSAAGKARDAADEVNEQLKKGTGGP